jgi:hypothetical protein
MKGIIIRPLKKMSKGIVLPASAPEMASARELKIFLRMLKATKTKIKKWIEMD